MRKNFFSARNLCAALALLCLWFFPAGPSHALVNGGFETGDTSGWITRGDILVVDSDFGSGPAEGTFQLLLTTLNESVDFDRLSGTDAAASSELESLLALPGSLSGIGAVEGSVAQQIFSANTGDTLSFRLNFLSDEIPAQSTANDAVVVVVDGVVSSPADLYSVFLPDSTTEFISETGFATATVPFKKSGPHRLALMVVDAADGIGASALLVDDIRITPPVYVDSDGDDIADWWETLFFLTLARDGTLDWDNDGLNDRDEYDNDCDPTDADSDDDGYSDGDEVNTHGTDPNDPASHPLRPMPWMPLLLGE